jgi:radical SAM protein with 4Fe4S-binding SPASM domain
MEQINNNQYNYDHMVYLRIFEGCNLSCEHCFIPSNPKKMDLEQFSNNWITQQLFDYGNVKENEKIYFQWHGGEPTLLGVDFLKQAIENVTKDNRLQYQHGIQTNLLNFDKETEKWVDLYKKYFDGQLGISWDYSIRHVKVNSISPEESNARFEEKFWSNVELAQNSGLELYMVITATKLFFEHYKNPIEFYQFLVDKNINKVNFERITKNGFARNSWDKLGLNNLEYSQYMSKFFKAYKLFKENNPEVNLHISPFDGLTQSVEKLLHKEKIENKEKADLWDIMSYKNQGYGCWSGECDTKFHTIDSNGYKHGCTALTSETDNNNKEFQSSIKIDSKKIFWINSSSRDNIIDKRQQRQESCQTCEFLSICSSGCLSVEKFDESGECSGAKTLFNTIYQNLNQ